MYDRTGWPAGLLQDDDRKLSRWFAGRPGARRQVDELHDLPKLAAEGCAAAAARLRAVPVEGGGEHDAGAFMPAAQGSAGSDGGGAEGVAVEVRAWGEGTGPLIYTATLTAKNGRKVNGMGFTPEGAEEDALQGWMRGEG